MTSSPGPAVPFERSGSLVDRFDAVAAKLRSRPAISDAEGEWTYAELRHVQARIRSTLAVSVRPQEVVAVLLPHDKRFAAALLGVLAAGCVCVPLDAEHPVERNRRIAAVAGAVAVITVARLAASAAELFPKGRVLDFDELATRTASPPQGGPGPGDAAYVIYTSGSTGNPKGVYWDHRSMVYDVEQNVSAMGIGPGDRVAMFYSPSVFGGMRTCLTTLLSGASGHVLSIADGASSLAREIRVRQLTVLRSSPALLRHIVDALGPDEQLDSVRLALIGGDRITWNDFDVFRRACRADAAFGVHLGATECSIHTEWLVDERVRTAGSRLPVGRPLPERSVQLLGADNQPVPDGEIGECVVASRFIARGYWKDPQRTAQAFSVDSADGTIRVYRTGDLAVRRPDGLIEYIGRRDEQIRLAGRRVEPGEIEAALRSCDGVRDGAVVARLTSDGATRAIVAYVERLPGARGLLSRHVKAMLLARVPRHMVPAQVMFLERLPRLSTLKIDRVALARIDADVCASAVASADDPVVHEVIAVIEETLGVQGATGEDTLASLGGDSLQALTVLARLESRLGLRLPLDQLEAAPSIADLARSITALLARRREARAAAGTVRPQRRRAEALPRLHRASVDSWRDAAEQVLQAAREPRGPGDPNVLSIDRNSVGTWLSGVEAMLQAGAIEAARSELAAFGGVHPDFEFAQTLRRILSNLPAEDARTAAFADDGSDVQLVVHHPRADTLCLVFAGHNHSFGLPTPILHRWLGRLPAHIVYLRDFRRCHYLQGLQAFGEGRAATLAALDHIRRELRVTRLVCWGHSSGAIAALQYGLELSAEAVVSVSGPINFTRDFNVYLRWSWLASRLRRIAAQSLTDIRQAWLERQRVPRTLLVYGDNYWDDRLQADYLRGIPSITHLPIENHADHHAVREIVRRGWYPKLLEWLVVGECPLPALIADDADLPIDSRPEAEGPAAGARVRSLVV
jgi:amino acid adenylation domain-containing protein